ncbi:unnamed protein product [Cylindrotheca closterium]|uniref:Uncharacterized protein n=1 Tax=Cylindrotheca closterium TaxID=2856 RepID=A0AAD2G3X7_9STRA|nr:unnamed protein product [Cylindrotheca closterium]
MKFSSALLLVNIVAFSDAGAPKVSMPKVSVGLNVGEDAAGKPLGGLEPRVQWQQTGTVAGCDVEGGFSADITNTDEVPSPSYWGKIKKSFEGIGDLSLRGDVDSAFMEKVALELRASGYGTDAQVQGSVDTKSRTGSVSKIQVSKTVDALGGSLKVNPSYNVPSSAVGAKIGYSLDNTSVQVDSTAKKITVAHCFGKDTVTPSVTTGGDFSLSYSRTLPEGTVTTSWTPDDSIGVTWDDGEWQTTFKAPLDGLVNVNQGIKVNMRRTIDFN